MSARPSLSTVLVAQGVHSVPPASLRCALLEHTCPYPTFERSNSRTRGAKLSHLLRASGGCPGWRQTHRMHWSAVRLRAIPLSNAFERAGEPFVWCKCFDSLATGWRILCLRGAFPLGPASRCLASPPTNLLTLALGAAASEPHDAAVHKPLSIPPSGSISRPASRQFGFHLPPLWTVM